MLVSNGIQAEPSFITFDSKTQPKLMLWLLLLRFLYSILAVVVPDHTTKKCPYLYMIDDRDISEDDTIGQ